MGQIMGSAAKPKRCNLNQLSQVPTPAAGEYILVSSDNSMNAAGQGNFDCYIVGNGSTAATLLELKYIDELISVEYGKNLFNKNAAKLEGYYISTNNGANSPNATSAISGLIPVEPNTIYYIFRPTSLAANEVRCVTADGQFVKVLNTDGTERSSFTFNASGAFMTPANAKFFQFTCKFVGRECGYDGTQVELGDSFTGYEAFTERRYIPYEHLPEGLSTIREEIEEMVFGVDDEPIIIGSYEQIACMISGSGKWYNDSDGYSHILIPVSQGEEYVVTANANYRSLLAYLTSNATPVANQNAPIVAGTERISITKGESLNLTIPSGCHYLYVLTDEGTRDSTPASIIKKGTEGLDDRIEKIEGRSSSKLYGKTVMFFGDSLTAASSVGVVGFAQIIAENEGLPYKAFLLDSHDGNTVDVPLTEPCFVNYGKDGTTNLVKTSRSDSVLERVRYHITANSDVQFALIECCVNDIGVSLGVLSDSYTATFDTSTTIGALEETCRYLTTLGIDLHVGFWIPWRIYQYTDEAFNACMDGAISVFEKWGVPYFDMRKSSGFYLKGCLAHRLLYTLTNESYSTYSSTTTYNLDDKVKYGGNLYKCLADGVVGIPPTDTTKWMMVSTESADGCHLNNLGHKIVAGKIEDFIERL